MIDISLLDAADIDAAVPGLAEVLVDCVQGGASLGFLNSITTEEAEAWWQNHLNGPRTLTWVARDGDAVVGVVQLELAEAENAQHRAEVRKLLVKRHTRGQGVARLLLKELEAHATEIGRWMLILDTQTDSDAESVYEYYGWRKIGTVDHHAFDPTGNMSSTTFMAKELTH